MAGKIKTDTPRGGKRSTIKLNRGQLRINPSAAKTFNKGMKESVKAGKPGAALKTTSSGFKVAKTNSPRQQSMPVKNAKNKMKAQGAKVQSQGVQYSRGTKPKGK